MKRTMTAPLGRIEVDNPDGQGTIVIGKMRDVRVTETLRRGRVSGIGELTPHEVPALEWNGNLTASFHFIDLTGADNGGSGFPGSTNRTAGSIGDYVNNVLLQEDGLTIKLLKKVRDSVDANGIITPRFEVIGTVIGAFNDRESFDISEGQVSGHNQDFTYLNPIIFTP